jgi:hypothetical protein
MTNRRSEPRFCSNQPVNVTALDAPDPMCSGTIVDFSASGIALHVPICLAVGCRVELTWPLGTIVAEVRNCRQLTPSTYRVGLKIREVSSRVEVAGQAGAA